MGLMSRSGWLLLLVVVLYALFFWLVAYRLWYKRPSAQGEHEEDQQGDVEPDAGSSDETPQADDHLLYGEGFTLRNIRTNQYLVDRAGAQRLEFTDSGQQQPTTFTLLRPHEGASTSGRVASDSFVGFLGNRQDGSPVCADAGVDVACDEPYATTETERVAYGADGNEAFKLHRRSGEGDVRFGDEVTLRSNYDAYRSTTSDPAHKTQAQLDADAWCVQGGDDGHSLVCAGSGENEAGADVFVLGKPT